MKNERYRGRNLNCQDNSQASGQIKQQKVHLLDFSSIAFETVKIHKEEKEISKYGFETIFFLFDF